MIQNKMKKIIINLSILVSFFVSIQITHAIEYGGFGGRPSFPRADNPRTESIFVHTVDVGDIVQEGVTVINNSAERQSLLVYATDSARSTDGAFACKQLSEERTNAGSWISLEPTEVILPAYGSQFIPFSINIPDTAGVGEHNGCILIQKIIPEDTEGAEERSGANISVRTGLRVALTITGDIERKIEIDGLDVTLTERDTFIIHPSIKNTGNVSVDVDLIVRTRSFLGYLVKENSGEYPILRNEISAWNFESYKPFFGGFNFVSMEVRYSDDDNLGEKNQILQHPTLVFFSFPTIPGLIIQILFLIIIVFLCIFYRKRRKEKLWIKTEWKEYDVKEGDDIKTLADQRGTSWKLIVKVNNLNPPYVLKEGDCIIIPEQINKK